MKALKAIGFLAASLCAAGIAVSYSIDRLADTSFAWHMVQHVVLLFIVPLLLVAARPFDLFAALASKRATAALVRATRPLHAIASPGIALSIFVGTLWLTHYSGLYELALERPPIHLAEHALYVAAGIVFWLPVLAPPPLRPLPFPARLLYLVVALPQGAFLGLALFASREPLYSHYLKVAGSAARALNDQHDAAAVMWILGGSIVFAAFLITLGVWASRESESNASLAPPVPLGEIR